MLHYLFAYLSDIESTSLHCPSIVFHNGDIEGSAKGAGIPCGSINISKGEGFSPRWDPYPEHRY